MTNTSRFFTAVLCGGLMTVVFPGLPVAHATLEKAEPAAGAVITAPPPHLRLWFNENVDLPVSAVSLKGPAGAVQIGKVQAVEPKCLIALVTGSMVDGAYTVAWQTAGDDGHTEKGTVTFTLKRGR